MLTEAPALPVAGAFCIAGSFAVSRALGDDARVFLNGQLSSDVKTLSAGRWQLSSYSTPKGRALATFVLAANGAAPSGVAGPGGPESFWLVTRRSVAVPTFKRLGMFVLRSKVKWLHETHAVVGVCGPAGRAALADLLGAEPPSAGECQTSSPLSPLAALVPAVHAAAPDASAAETVPAVDPREVGIIGLGEEAWWLLVPIAAVPAVAAALRASLPEIGAARWDAVEVAAGRPWVETDTVESFVPQMLNLDLTGGISFKKGCYPGQEIVARTQYLGKVKRRMLRFACHLGDDGPAPPGTPVYAAGDADQALGEVVLAAPLADGRGQLLAVLQMDLAAGADLRLAAADGPALTPLALPYTLDPA